MTKDEKEFEDRNRSKEITTTMVVGKTRRLEGNKETQKRNQRR